MNLRTSRAIRFVHPDFSDRHATIDGVVTNIGGSLDLIDGVDAVRQSLQLLLTTRPGERVMRPGYGCRLHELAFSVNDDTTAGLAIYFVRQAIQRWEPRVEVLSIDAHRDISTPSRLELVLDYRVRPHLTRAQMRLPLDLMLPEAQ